MACCIPPAGTLSNALLQLVCVILVAQHNQAICSTPVGDPSLSECVPALQADSWNQTFQTSN